MFLSILLYVLVAIIIFGLAASGIAAIPMSEPFKGWAKIVLVIILVILLVAAISGGISFPRI